MAVELTQDEINQMLKAIDPNCVEAVDLTTLPFREALYAIIRRAMYFCVVTHCEGFLDAEKYIDHEKEDNRDIFEYGMRFVVDGTDESYINKILSNIIKQEKDEQKILLKTIQKEAVLAIQIGYSPGLLAALMNSYTDIPLNDLEFKKIKDKSMNTVSLYNIMRIKNNSFSTLETLITGFRKSELVIISSTPEKGKTLLALTMAETMVCGGKPTAFFYLKETKDTIEKTLRKIESSITDGWDFVPDQLYPYLIHTSRMTFLKLEQRIRKECDKKNIEAVFVDNLELLSGDNTEYAVWITKLKALAKELNILIVVVLQIPENKECSSSSVESMISSAEFLKYIYTLIIIKETDTQKRMLDVYKDPGTMDYFRPPSETIQWSIT